MNRFSRLAPFALALGAAAMLGACQGSAPEAPQPSEAASAPSGTAPETKPGLALSGGRLILPAVSGNPAAAYFTLTNGSPKPVAIAAVAVTGASMVMLHETRDMGGHSTMADMAAPELKPGETLVLAPGGKHVMIHDVPAEWKAGGSAELTLTFADGDKLSAPLAIQAPGSQ